MQQSIIHMETLGPWQKLLDYFASPAASARLLQTAEHVASASGAGAILVTVVVIIFVCLVIWFLRGLSRQTLDQPPKGEAPPSRLPEEIAAIPMLSQRYVVPSSESQFSVDMKELTALLSSLPDL